MLAATAVALWAAAPAVAQGTIHADEFSGSSLDTSVWSLADPLGDAGVSVSGGTANVALPAGTSHDVWGNVNTVSGLRQAAPDRDFEIEAKFASVVSSGFQMQGVIVEQDANDLVRAEVHHDGGGTRLFVATMFNGNPEVRHYSTVPDGGPVYIRVVRVGNDWRVRYSRDGSTWTTTEQFNLPIVVGKVGPLVGNGGGPGFTGRIDSFREVLPDTADPVIGGIASAPRTLDATVTWTTDEPATSEVAYGPTTAYGSARVGSDGLTTDHSVVIHGLGCGRTYHFQVKSKDASNNASSSADQTLTTAACPTAMQSDEFNGPSLDTDRWTLVDPGGGATASGNGSQAVIDLPAGIQHDAWTGSDTMARLLQPAPDDDFELRVKYDSIVDATYQMQGLVVEQDSNDLLRLEVHREGTSTRLFAASIENGVASVIQSPVDVPDGSPVFLRLRRSGDQWAFSYSQNGTTWPAGISFTRVMDVTAAGLQAGNSGPIPPAFQARADWFRYTPPDRTPPAISAVAATPAPAGARVTWTTDEPSGSAVEFGATTAYGDGTISVPGDATDHAVALHGLKCATTYHYRVRSADPAGNTATGPDGTVTTAPCPAFLGSDEFDGATLDTSKWAFVDPLGDSSMAMAAGAAQLAVPAGTAHDLWSTVRTVPRLLQTAPDTDFELVTRFQTAVGATTQQQGIVVEESHRKLLRFETYYEGSSTHLFVAYVDGGSAEVVHDAVVPSGAPVYLKLRRVGDRWTFSQSHDGESWRSTTFVRALDVTAVGPYVGNGGRNPAFQGRIDYFREVTDRTPPVITRVGARPVSRQAQVTWTTDEPARSTVDYREGDGEWRTASSSQLMTRHSVVADGLECETMYSFRVSSADALGNAGTSAVTSFTTAPCTPTGGPDVDVWNGSSQTFGTVGIPQTWVNIAGNVSDPDGVQKLEGRINGGGWETLGHTPDGWRIARPGDFNYEVNISELLPGDNFAELRATDGGGRTTTRKVTVNWQGLGAGAPPAADGPVVVVAARPSDEARNFAGVIDSAKAAGRRVYVVVFTNGEGSAVSRPGNYCNAPADAAAHAGYGLMRDREARDSMAVLGLTWSANLSQTELIYLGYPGRRVADVASSDEGAVTNVQTGVQRTYAEDFDGDEATCDGDFRYLLDGTHSPFTAQAMRADLDALLALTAPSDIYTHAPFDGQADQAEVGRQLRAAVRRTNAPARLHTVLQHPEGEGNCQATSAERWPNPSLGLDGDPFARFTPKLDFTAPPASPCDPADATTSWGPMGAPTEHVEVPSSMQVTDEAANKKWQAIAAHDSLVDCSGTPGDYHVSCGYMRAFVKLHEPFWRYDYGSKRLWPRSYTAQWTSNSSISQQAQVLEGQWRYEGDGVRPLTTGFDRALIVGDTGWTDYEVRMPFTIHSFNPSTGQGAAVGLGLGWQGHNAWGQPRHGHPGGGLCLYARPGSEGTPTILQIGYSPGPVDDTTLVAEDASLAAGVPYVMRFRQQDGFAPGQTRYSCKVWRANQAEPAEWDLQTDIPDWPGTSGQRSGSAVLLAHEVDATFGDTTFTPLP